MAAGSRRSFRKGVSLFPAVVERLKLDLGSGDKVFIVAVVRAETTGAAVAVLVELCKNMAYIRPH